MNARWGTATVGARTAAAAALLAGGAVVALAPGADAARKGPEDLPAPTAEQLAASVHVWDPSGSVRVWDVAGSVRTLETVETGGGETTISLATDILFTPDSAELPANAADRIAELIVDVPDGSAVAVEGHTDSVQGAVDNQQLSAGRAAAVAEVLRGARPDLTLEVAGFANTRPAVAENPDDPSTRAANRRVEIVYHG
jgi:outer membrane protein OmpA-like peptidoglycan-associated protein